MVGKTLGHYKILEPLGAGGMGEVYRAHDASLKRDVAIKVLPEDLADDPDRLARLEREAHLLAALNHPNVATIHGFEESDGTRFLVMELVKGESLEARLAGGRLPVDEALDICRQIAEALEAAHEQGIIHRDLKPGNVLVTPEGKAKVLDFGLAKTTEAVAPERDLSHSPTMTVAGTQTGVILGTAPYMSPEQVRGQPVDKRTDIWAFGGVLYEALVGRRAFDRETVADTLAAILEAEPDWGMLPAATPVTIQSLVRRCLRKDPNRRLHDIADARIEIEEAGEPGADASLGGAGVGIAGAAVAWNRTSRAVAVAIAATAMIAGGLIVWSLVGRAPDPPRAVLVETPDPLHPNFGQSSIAISPNGQHLAVVVGDGRRTHLVHRPMGQFASTRIPGSEEALRPFFSPDSEWIGFSAKGNLKKASIAGGNPVDVCEGCVGAAGAAATWNPAGDEIVFATGGALWRVAAKGGQPTIVGEPEAGQPRYESPEFLPDGRAVLLEARRAPGSENYGIAALDLGTNVLTPLVPQGTNPAYAASGHLIFGRRGALFAVPFDASRRSLSGEPVRVVQDVSSTSGYSHEYSVSREGSLAYVEQSTAPWFESGTLVWVDRTGDSSPLSERREAFRFPVLSPDGRRVAVHNASANEPRIPGVSHIDIYEIEEDHWTRLTVGAGWKNSPLWTPDGARVVFNIGGTTAPHGGPYNLFSMASDFSSNEPVRLFDHEASVSANSFSPTGDLVFSEEHAAEQGNILLLPADGGAPQYVIQTLFDERQGSVSPTGRWIAYRSDRSDDNEVWVEPFPGGGRRVKVSDGGGNQPRWSPDETELFYVNGTRMIAAQAVADEQEFSVGSREILFDDPMFLWAGGYDVDLRGQRFLMLRKEAGEVGVDTPPGNQIKLVLNWFEELKRLVPTGR